MSLSDPFAFNERDTFKDPLANPRHVSDEQVAAAFTRPNGNIEVLTGARLGAWIVELLEANLVIAVERALEDARQAWGKETTLLIEQALAENQDRFNAILAAARSNETRPIATPSGKSSRRTLNLPDEVWVAARKSAIGRGVSISDLITELLQAAIVLDIQTTPAPTH